MESEEFLLLPVNQLVQIISSEELNVQSEEQVYLATIGWFKYNLEDRKSHLYEVGTLSIGKVIIVQCIAP